MLAPVTYQGGKGRLAGEIVSRMRVPTEATFYDLCCGSGAVSLALCKTGHSPDRIVMVDQGPWGAFWEKVGAETFDLGIFRSYCDSVPSDRREIKAFIEKMHQELVDEHGVYKFLLLQAAAIGGKAVWWEGDKWASSGYRNYWQPTETSSRRSPVNPMMPMPATIYSRTVEIIQRMRGMRGICGDAAVIKVQAPAVAYIDPPYAGTTDYPYRIDAVAVARNIGCPCWVSESRGLSEYATMLSIGRTKGGITGDRKKEANEKWLSFFENSGSSRVTLLHDSDLEQKS